MIALFIGSTAIVMTRPEVTAGPIERAFRPANVSAVNVCDAAGRAMINPKKTTAAAGSRTSIPMPISDVHAEADTHDPWREDLRRQLIRAADRERRSDHRVRVAHVVQIETRHQLSPLAELDRTRDAQIDRGDVRVTFGSTLGQEDRLARPRQRRHERARHLERGYVRVSLVRYQSPGHLNIARGTVAAGQPKRVLRIVEI